MSNEECDKAKKDQDANVDSDVKCDRVEGLSIEIPNVVDAPPTEGNKLQQRRYSQGSVLTIPGHNDNNPTQCDPFPFSRHSSDNIRSMALLENTPKQDTNKCLKKSWHEEHNYRELDDIIESPMAKTPAEDWPLSHNQHRSMVNQLNIDMPLEKRYKFHPKMCHHNNY